MYLMSSYLLDLPPLAPALQLTDPEGQALMHQEQEDADVCRDRHADVQLDRVHLQE